MAGGLARLGGGILRGAWNLVKGRPLLTGATAFGYAAYHEEINEAVGNAFKNPGETIDSARETVGGGIESFTDLAQGARRSVEGAVDTAGNLQSTLLDWGPQWQKSGKGPNNLRTNVLECTIAHLGRGHSRMLRRAWCNLLVRAIRMPQQQFSGA